MPSKSRVFKKLVGIVLVLTILSSGNVYASESTSGFQVQNEVNEDNQLSSAIKFFNKYDIDKKVQDNLIKKYNKGILWDSLKENAKPIRSEKKEFENYIETVNTYNDGSIDVTTMSEGEVFEVTEKEDDMVSVLGVSGGTVTSGSGYTSYKGAQVYTNNGMGFARFTADFTIVKNGNDYIGAAYSASGGVYLFPTIARRYETSTYKANAHLLYRYTYAGQTYTKRLNLYVGNDTYSGS